MIYDLNDKINFGKYTGVEIREIWVWDKRYFNWLIKTCDNFHLSEESEEEVRILRSKFKNPKKDKSRKLNASQQAMVDCFGHTGMDGGWGNGI